MGDGFGVSQFRDTPVSLERAFGGIIDMDVPTVFRRRYGPIPPIKSLTGSDVTNWTGTVGQTRVLVLGGGGSIRETVVRVDEPHSWAYVITDFVGPLAVLLRQIDGEFGFAPAGTGTRITWRYVMHPRNGLARLGLPALGWFWRGYARQMLEELSASLVD
jgi:hypothetical protein